MLKVILVCYTEFEERVGMLSVGRSAILAALKKLTEENEIVKCGSGKNTYYVRSDVFEE